MPSHRKRGINTAHRMPKNRLPLGVSLDRSHSSGKSSDVNISSTLLEQELSSKPPPIGAESMERASMSIAETKLLRQNERIEQDEAARKASLLLEKASPSKRKITKPTDSREGSSPSSGVRLDAYRTASREPSVHNTLISGSHPVSGHEPIALERQDSANPDDIGFRLYTGRKAKRTPGEMNVYTKTDEIRQVSVEAKFDRHEMFEVFGRELPGPDFLQQEIGGNDGQVLFVQHPNGDVSAHQWNQSIYEWVNIGQFSNIRKKIEGQMASDRLRGETTHQMLQQNTLAYFRTVARQREASSMGLPFGQKQIDDALPGANRATVMYPAAAARLPINVSFPKEEARPQEQVMGPSRPLQIPREWINSSAIRPTVPSVLESASMSAGQSQIGDALNRCTPANISGLAASERIRSLQENLAPVNMDSFESLNRTQDDPFTMSRPAETPAIVGLRIDSNTNRGQLRQLPPGLVPALNTSAPTSVEDVRQSVNDVLQRNRMSFRQLHQETSQFSSPPAYNQGDHRAADLARAIPDRNVPHNDGRVAMLDHLRRLGASARERSNNVHGSNRTVMHDPLRSDRHRAESLGPTLSTPQRYMYGSAGLNPGRLTQPNYILGSRMPNLMAEEDTSLAFPATSARPNTGTVGQELANTLYFEKAMQFLHGNSDAKDEEVSDRSSSAARFALHEEFYRQFLGGGAPNSSSGTDITRVLVPVLDNLSSYVYGPNRRDYWCQWVTPPEWCIDRSETGNDSFFEVGWGQPPARVGRDSRYRPLPVESRFTSYSPAGSYSSSSSAVGSPAGPNTVWNRGMSGHYTVLGRGGGRY